MQSCATSSCRGLVRVKFGISLCNRFEISSQMSNPVPEELSTPDSTHDAVMGLPSRSRGATKETLNKDLYQGGRRRGSTRVSTRVSGWQGRSGSRVRLYGIPHKYAHPLFCRSCLVEGRMSDPKLDEATMQKIPALDFLSAEFDPVLALSTPGLAPPDPDASPLDNVAKCRSILPQEVPEALSNVEKRAGSEVRTKDSHGGHETMSQILPNAQRVERI